MKFDFVVLGATGDEGNIASKDLLESGYSVLLCGRNKSRVEHLLKYSKAKFVYVDLNNVEETAKIIKESGTKIVVNCAELRLNINAMKVCLLADVNYLDLGGLQEMTRQQFKLDNDFKKRNLVALTGCGSTPGSSNVMAAYAVNKLDSVNSIDLGFVWDSNIKEFVLPYSIESIVYELTTEPIVLENGKFRREKACFPVGIKNIKGIGKQNTYCIVHSEVFTFSKYFKKNGLKTIHYKAGFPDYSFKVLNTIIKLGFGSSKPIEIKGVKLRPIDFTREVLKNLPRSRNYKEKEAIWIKIYGKKNKRDKELEMYLIVNTIKGWEEFGSNIDTGMSISIMAQMIQKGLIKKTGVTAPEAAVPPIEFFKELKKRGMHIYLNNKKIF